MAQEKLEAATPPSTRGETVAPELGPAGSGGTLGLFLHEMRVRQWSKNLVLFAALIFSKNLLQIPMVLRSMLAFVVFCLLSGVVYTVNDLLDLEADRRHEVKRRRPLASGQLRVRTALTGVVLVLGLALMGAALLGPRFFLISVGFLAFNLAYSLVLKNIVIVDVISIAISFLIRAIAGVVALNTATVHLTISPWLLVVTFFLSLFLGLCKRLHEYRSILDAGKHRSTLMAYSEELLNQLINVAATGTLIAYSIYTIWPETVQHFGTENLMYTIPIVVAGLTRYMFLVYRRNLGGDPAEILLTERSLWATVIAWFLCVAVVIYRAQT
ncbi:MAG TPA: decaprenyl-phosphate phosphoribosyltransferase [Candidatus Krumholzibacteria bacterium]|nr:decaprenyl-phosphate phosphoribosyltransferase [Candidatus Krumholzibacteria bacterium]